LGGGEGGVLHNFNLEIKCYWQIMSKNSGWLQYNCSHRHCRITGADTCLGIKSIFLIHGIAATWFNLWPPLVNWWLPYSYITVTGNHHLMCTNVTCMYRIRDLSLHCLTLFIFLDFDSEINILRYIESTLFFWW
jgi:hypothetical protein